jgi:hypothetical protein
MSGLPDFSGLPLSGPTKYACGVALVPLALAGLSALALKVAIFSSGDYRGMAEWSMAVVLKTDPANRRNSRFSA